MADHLSSLLIQSWMCPIKWHRLRL